MARGREIGELDCNRPFALAAAQVIEVRADEVIDQSSGVLDLDEIEHVHDMRVATRRLQAAMEVFRKSFPRNRRRSALKQVRALADALGERRDPDVSIETLERLAEEINSGDDPGIVALIEHFRREQAAANERLAPFVAEERLRLLRSDLGELAASARKLAAAGTSGS